MKTQYKLLLCFIGIGIIMYLKNKTLNIEIKREIITATRTIGKMFVNGQYFCDTLEDTYRTLNSASDKIKEETAIPNGVYKIALTYSKKFAKMLPEIFDVPFFTGIRIHTGSSEKDTAGCVLVGDYKNGIWSANPNYVAKLKDMLPLYSNATVSITKI